MSTQMTTLGIGTQLTVAIVALSIMAAFCGALAVYFLVQSAKEMRGHVGRVKRLEARVGELEGDGAAQA